MDRKVQMRLPMCARAAIAASLILPAGFTVGAGAQQPAALLPLPQLGRCDGSSQPVLPEKWRATYLMAPFTDAQLVLADIESDASLSAMRVRLHGVARGSLDVFVHGNNTYQVVSEGSEIRQCRNLGDTGWRPLPRNWLAPRSRCTASAPIGTTEVNWWKTPIAPAPASYWIWSKTSDQSPFRLVFPFASDSLPPLSRHALSYQVDFQSLSQSGLADVAAACRDATPATARNGALSLRALLEAMPQSPHRSGAAIKALMPALDAACPDVPLPKWPERLALTGVMTPFDSDENPYPAEVLYDWTVPAQRSRIYGGPRPAIAAQDSLLLEPLGYTVTHYRSKGMTCRAVLPGTIRPDWATRAPCKCAATINGFSPLSPHGTTRVMACPLASPRVAWAWYALTGRPDAFMVTSLPGDEGKRLFAVLDYREWLPDHPFPRSVFDKPAQCTATSRPRRSTLAPAASGCSTCHLGNSPR
jgi:hypothetical protein